MKDAIVIAVDGPSASGKGTVGRMLATKLGFRFVDTGAMYRTFTWHCLRARINLADPGALATAVRNWPAELTLGENEIHLLVDGYLPVSQIRSDEVSNTVARVSPLPAVRMWMVRTQRECLRFGNLVMDGRDVGTHVFPESPLKFFLTAREDVRARRRRNEGSRDNTAERDRLDATRRVAPLEPARDAVIVDNSHDNPAATVDFILAHVHSQRIQIRL